MLNTLAYLQGVLEPFAFTLEKRGLVQGLMEGKVLQLIEDHVSFMPRPLNPRAVADTIKHHSTRTFWRSPGLRRSPPHATRADQTSVAPFPSPYTTRPSALT